MDRFITLSSRLAAAIGLLALLLLSLAILCDALSRTVLAAPIFGLSDLVELTAPVIVASCFPMALANRQHITIRFLGRAASPRFGQAVELLGQLAAFVVFAAMAVEVGRYTWGLVAHNQFTWLLRVPIWPSWILTTVLFALCVPIQGLVLVEVVRDLRAGRPLRSASAEMLHEVE